MRTLLLATAVVTLILTTQGAVPAAVARKIEGTVLNQKYFKLVQEIISRASASESGCGPENNEIQRCIQKCNSPGSIDRDGCCCDARNKKLTLGLAGGCKYLQQLLNFSDDRLGLTSRPVVEGSDAPYFGNDCSAQTESTLGHSCSCELTWTIKRSELEASTPRPSPTEPSQSPKTTPSAKASPKPRKPRLTRKPSESPTDTSGQGEAPPTSNPTETATASETPSVPSTPTDPDDGTNPTPSDEAVESPDVDGGVCVDVDYLTKRGYKAHDLVHRTSISSPVYCPAYNDLPCATANHKVRLNGVTLSYAQLCEREDISCRSDVRDVNSVWTHQWQEVAHGDAHLTMYDVRYSEGAQRLLHRVMRSFRSAYVVRRLSSSTSAS